MEEQYAWISKDASLIRQAGKNVELQDYIFARLGVEIDEKEGVWMRSMGDINIVLVEPLNSGPSHNEAEAGS